LAAQSLFIIHVCESLQESKMKKGFARKLPLYLLPAVLAVSIKYHYSTADSSQLQWILGPTAWLVSFLTDTRFTFIAARGYVSANQDIIIAPACGGLNFLIICFCMLVFSFMHRTKTLRRGLCLIATSCMTALCLTLVVNTARIILTMRTSNNPLAVGILSSDRLHRLEGICIYFLALSLLYYAAAAAANQFLERRASIFSNSILKLAIFSPFFWYLLIMVGIPILRGSYSNNLSAFMEHSLFVTIVPLMIMTVIFGLKLASSYFLAASSPTRIVVIAVCLLPIGSFYSWNPWPVSEASFDVGSNGLWISGKWYTGFSSDSWAPVTSDDISSLITTFRKNHIRYAYVRAGSIKESGEIEHMPGQVFFELQDRAPDVVFLPWISGEGDKLDLHIPQWRDRLVQSIGRLYSCGVRGIHLNIEPIRDNEVGYVELLKEIRARFEGNFLVSHATRRVAPMGGFPFVKSYSWSREFYQSTMNNSDQTVLMGYNTALQSSKLYCAYMSHQTTLLLSWASSIDGHGVIIGIPAYDDVPFLSNPRVENVLHAVSGVRAALEEFPSSPTCFQGVSIYANWSVSPDEWIQYQTHWL
jgi:exosortase K